MTNFELATHVPLIVRAPWKPRAVNASTAAFAEAVDFYPTLVELAGLPHPASQGEDLNGTSLAPVFDDPLGAAVKDAAFSQFSKRALTNIDPKFRRNQTALMGYSIRVEDWRYTCWFDFDNVSLVPLTGEGHSLGNELYDHRGDTGLWLDYPGENANVVAVPEYASVVRELHQRVLDYIQLRPVNVDVDVDVDANDHDNDK